MSMVYFCFVTALCAVHPLKGSSTLYGKKKKAETLSIKTQTSKLTLLLVLWYCSWFFGLYLIEAFEIL